VLSLLPPSASILKFTIDDFKYYTGVYKCTLLLLLLVVLPPSAQITGGGVGQTPLPTTYRRPWHYNSSTRVITPL